MIKEHDCVILTQDLADEGLVAGDIGTVVHIHQSGSGYEVESMTLTQYLERRGIRDRR